MKVKICGLHNAKELNYLIGPTESADYAGFVLYKKSKRYVSSDDAGQMIRTYKRDASSVPLQFVAVTVSPDLSLLREAEETGFDILQVHGRLTEEVLAASTLPVWYAFNISDAGELAEKKKFLTNLAPALAQKITGIVVDGAESGSGHTFSWRRTLRQELSDLLENRILILAGGLTSENVREGIAVIEPDVLDVSSGVESGGYKQKELVHRFIETAKSARDTAAAGGVQKDMRYIQ